MWWGADDVVIGAPAEDEHGVWRHALDALHELGWTGLGACAEIYLQWMSWVWLARMS